jgi:hypothetical protein
MFAHWSHDMSQAIVDPMFPSVVRSTRGLTVSGRRLTLYSLQDHFKSGWPPELVMDWFNLSPKELGDVVGYVAAHRDEFEAEYQQVVRECDQTRRYWEQRNRSLMEEIRSNRISLGKTGLQEDAEPVPGRSP